MTHHADVDIDLADRQQLIDVIECTTASLKNGKKHNSGVYVQPIPTTPFTKQASIDYKEADARGYFKIDLLNVAILNEIKDNEHYEKLLATTPPWEKLHDTEFVTQIIHISNYDKSLKNITIDSIPKLAMFVAAIRPAKIHLLGKPWEEVEKTIWDKPISGYYYKKAHAISYAVLVALHMNIVNEKLSHLTN